jgi:hypothetical protein
MARGMFTHEFKAEAVATEGHTHGTSVIDITTGYGTRKLLIRFGVLCGA